MTIFPFHCRGKQLVKTMCTAKYAVLQSQKKMILSVETLDTGLWNLGTVYQNLTKALKVYQSFNSFLDCTLCLFNATVFMQTMQFKLVPSTQN